MKNVKQYLMLTVVGVAVAAVIYLQFSVWMECRETNSFFYCMWLMSK